MAIQDPHPDGQEVAMRAQALGISVVECRARDRLLGLRAETDDLAGAHDRLVGYLELLAGGEVAHTLEHREAERLTAAYLAALLADDDLRAAFAAGRDGEVFAELRARVPVDHVPTDFHVGDRVD